MSGNGKSLVTINSDDTLTIAPGTSVHITSTSTGSSSNSIILPAYANPVAISIAYPSPLWVIGDDKDIWEHIKKCRPSLYKMIEEEFLRKEIAELINKEE